MLLKNQSLGNGYRKSLVNGSRGVVSGWKSKEEVLKDLTNEMTHDVLAQISWVTACRYVVNFLSLSPSLCFFSPVPCLRLIPSFFSLPLALPLFVLLVV